MIKGGVASLTEMTNPSNMQPPSLPVDDEFVLKRLEAISNYFRLGTINQADRIDGIHKNYTVTTESGQFIFKILIHHSLEVLKKELIYLERLEENHFPISHYLSSPDGSFAFQGSDFIAVAMPKLTGEIREPSEDVSRQIGLHLAQLHRIPTNGLPQKSHWLDKDYLPHAIELAKSNFGQDQVAEFIYVYKSLSHFNPDSFPQSIIHGDLRPANCLFTGNELTAILDWEEIGIGACILDFAWSVLSFCFVEQPRGRRKFDARLYKCLFDSYSQVRFFTKEEENCMEDAVKYAYLTFCLWIWLQFKLYYPEEESKDDKNYYELFELDTMKLR